MKNRKKPANDRKLKLVTEAPNTPPDIPAVATIEPPSGIPPDALAYWQRIAPSAIELGFLLPCDSLLFADYCQCLARLEQAETMLLNEGFVVNGRRGPTRHPAATIARQYRESAQRCEDRLGLNPRARARLKIKASIQAKDPWER